MFEGIQHRPWLRDCGVERDCQHGPKEKEGEGSIQGVSSLPSEVWKREEGLANRRGKHWRIC